MKDEVISALWKVKDDIARENDYDVKRLGAMVRKRERHHADRIVDWVGSKGKQPVSEEPEVS